MFADFIVSMGIFTHQDKNGERKAKDALFGLEIESGVTYNLHVKIGVEARYVKEICHL